MGYAIVEPPFALRFRERSKSELETYRTWFHRVSPERIAELAKAVQSTRGFEDWKPDLTPESLETLGRWFDGEVKTRKKTSAEVEHARATLAFPIDVPEEELNDRTYSLAIDIGMYFGQVVLKNLPGTRWDQPLKNTKFIDYGQPVIMGFGTVPLNPVGVMVTTAFGISRGKASRLRDLYDTWAKMRK
jgi:hypothetical protein